MVNVTLLATRCTQANFVMSSDKISITIPCPKGTELKSKVQKCNTRVKIKDANCDN